MIVFLLECFVEVEIDAVRTLTHTDVHPSIGAWLDFQAISDTAVGEEAVEPARLRPQRTAPGPDHEAVARQPAVTAHEHLAVLDESEQGRAIAKPSLDVTAEIVAGP